MSVSIRWHDAETKSILRYDIMTPWSWDAIFACWRVFSPNIYDRPGRLDAIVHIHDLKTIHGADTVIGLYELLQQAPPNLRAILYVGPSIRMWTIVGLLRQHYPGIGQRHVHQPVDTIAAAERFIQQQRQSEIASV